MKSFICTLVILAILFSGLMEASAKPIPTRNQMPLYLIYLQMLPEEASVVERNKGAMDADYTLSNITVSCFTPSSSLYDIQIDMEVARFELDFKYGLYDNLEVGIELPYLSFSKGYTDGFVEGFEDGINARTPRSRERQGTNKLDYTFAYDNVFLINQKESAEGLGDIVLNAKYQLLREEAWYMPNFSLRSAVKFPTAEDGDFLGSGEFDYGFGILADKSFFEKLVIYTAINAVYIEKPVFFSVLEIDREIYSFMAAAEYFFTPRFSLIAQGSGNSTPYPSSSTNVLDPGYEAGLGVNYIWKEKNNISWHFAVIENVDAASSPDVTFNAGFKVSF